MITIEEICGYLPYELNVTFEADEHTHRLVGLDITRSGAHIISPFNDFGIAEMEKIKPLLRPLSSLTTEQEINGEMVIPRMELLNLYSENNQNAITELEWEFKDGTTTIWGNEADIMENYEVPMPLFVYQQLYKWHFDLHGLLERGDAINLLEYKTIN